MMYISMLVSFALSLFLSYILIPRFINMLLKAKIVCENYKLEMIPTSVGLVFVFVQVITLGLMEIVLGFNDNFFLVYLLGFIFIGFLGLLDDLIGSKYIKGLRGHIKALFHGEITTGALKAIFGFFISLVTSSILSTSFVDFVINTFVIGLFTNFINLFDLRPGRAAKMFIFLAIILLIANINNKYAYIIWSFFGILIPYINLDLKARAMMGDVGSNTLGYTLGVFAVTSFHITGKLIILILLVIFHILSEKVSFSKVIENNRFLKFLDMIGRYENDKL
ncbi:MAG: phospho-N-acetylmuramoyl-pentapeptide-transferase [Tissierellia bacterium]|nr:phospho-N-acetylmuramoyl-pentapeptide-transferase [Tissierellia bacterium]